MEVNEITYKIRGAIFDVYNTLGPSLLESVYEEALAYELTQQGLSVERQTDVPIVYKTVSLKTPLRIDLVVEKQIIVELKSVKELQDVHYKQLLTYLRLTGKRLGLLVNFNTSDIRSSIKRIIN